MHINLIASRPPGLHLLFPSDRWSKFVSSLEIQVEQYTVTTTSTKLQYFYPTVDTLTKLRKNRLINARML